jgi:hypothetical protein
MVLAVSSSVNLRQSCIDERPVMFSGEPIHRRTSSGTPLKKQVCAFEEKYSVYGGKQKISYPSPFAGYYQSGQ